MQGTEQGVSCYHEDASRCFGNVPLPPHSLQQRYTSHCQIEGDHVEDSRLHVDHRRRRLSYTRHGRKPSNCKPSIESGLRWREILNTNSRHTQKSLPLMIAPLAGEIKKNRQQSFFYCILEQYETCKIYLASLPFSRSICQN